MQSKPRVVVDSYNLRLKKGSGIKTYGLSLLEALKHMQAHTSLLTDRPMSSGDPLLSEVSFFDERPTSNMFPRLHRLIAATRMLKSRKAKALNPQVVARAERPFDKKDGYFQTLYNVPELFDSANRQFAVTGMSTRVRLPSEVDIFHATTALPVIVKKAAKVTTIHDVIPLRLPHTTLDNKRFFHKLVKNSIKRSDLILTVSNASKRDLIELFGVEESKVEVTWQSLPEQPVARPEVEQATLRAHNIESGEYILFVGNIEPKKNLGTLIRAMAALPGDLPLVVVGKRAWLWEEVMEDGPRYLGKRFRHLDYLPHTDLPTLYRHARLMVFPSIYEGFGLPPLEAMAHGCPVACSKLTSLPEVCADAAAYFDPYDADEMYGQIAAVLDDESLRQSLIEKGHARAAHFSMEAYAERLGAAYQKVL